VDADCGEYTYRPVAAVRSAPDPRDVEAAADVLLAAKNPVIHGGKASLGRGNTAVVQLADLLQIPGAHHEHR